MSDADWSVLVTLRDGTTRRWTPVGVPYRDSRQPDVREWMAAPRRWRDVPWPWEIASAVLVGSPPADVAVVLTTRMCEWALHEFPVSDTARFVESCYGRPPLYCPSVN